MRTIHASVFVIVGFTGCSDIKTLDWGSQSLPLSVDASTAPVLDASTADARKAEIEAWAMAYHDSAGHVVVLTETLEDGTVVDWVDMDSDPTTKEEHPQLDADPSPEGVERATLQELSGPPNSVPYVRPAFPPYVEGTSEYETLEEYIDAIPSGNANAPNDRLYVILQKEVYNYGVGAAINGYWYDMDLPTSPEFEINEVSVYCLDALGRQDQVGLAVGHHPQLYSGHRLMAEYFENDNGHWVPYTGYHQVHATLAPGMTVSGTSVKNGTQVESVLQVRFYSSYDPNRWYYFWGTTAIGYIDVDEAEIPSLDSSGCVVSVYGEAYDPNHDSQPWMDADMASGSKPTGSTFAANYGTRGFFRRPFYYTNTSGSATLFSSTLTNYDSACYKGLVTIDGTPSGSWNPTIFYGGDGGNTISCD